MNLKAYFSVTGKNSRKPPQLQRISEVGHHISEIYHKISVLSRACHDLTFVVTPSGVASR
jgi:hypothetical protein